MYKIIKTLIDEDTCILKLNGLEINLPIAYINGQFEIITKYGKYNRPLNRGEILTRDGYNIYQNLINDPIRKWRMDSGIELIYKKSSIEEVIEIAINWGRMTDNQKFKSDKKSVELFGMNNTNHLIKILSEYIG